MNPQDCVISRGGVSADEASEIQQAQKNLLDKIVGTLGLIEIPENGYLDVVITAELDDSQSHSFRASLQSPYYQGQDIGQVKVGYSFGNRFVEEGDTTFYGLLADVDLKKGAAEIQWRLYGAKLVSGLPRDVEYPVKSVCKRD